MKMNDFYEVNGCIDFIPVTIVGMPDDGVIVAPANDKRDCQLVVKDVYRLPKPQEPQKPVVPKFVAEWIEWCKANDVTLLGGISPIDELGSTICSEKRVKSRDATRWAKRNQETFARAWLDGYAIEQEKLYTVEIPNPNSAGGKLVLFKQQSSGRLILDILNHNINKPKYLHLTESEIKKDFEWAWQWAKEVK